jgi:hypothetical protein
VLQWMADTDAVIEARYIHTGYFQRPSIEALDRTCVSLRDSVGRDLRAKSINVRL